MWEWIWLEDLDSRASTPEILDSNGSMSNSVLQTDNSPDVTTYSEYDDDSIPAITHAVIFKF